MQCQSMVVRCMERTRLCFHLRLKRFQQPIDRFPANAGDDDVQGHWMRPVEPHCMSVVGQGGCEITGAQAQQQPFLLHVANITRTSLLF